MGRHEVLFVEVHVIICCRSLTQVTSLLLEEMTHDLDVGMRLKWTLLK